MESIMLYLLPLLLLLPLSFYLIFFMRKNGYQKKLVPPGSEGWPILGENVDYAIFGTQKLVRDRMKKYSPKAFKTLLFGERNIAVLCGAEGNKMIYKNESKLLKTWVPLSLRKVVFPDFMATGHRESMAVFHNLRYDVLKPEALRQYVAVADALACEKLDGSWRPNSVVKAFPWVRKFTFDLTCRLMMNVVDLEMVDKLQGPFDQLTNGMVSLPINLPGTAYNRAFKGGTVVFSELKRVIKARRDELLMTEGEGRVDMLSRLLWAINDDGLPLTDANVASFLIAMLVGGQYETSSAIAIVLHFLAELPHVYDEVYKEQMVIAKSKGPNEMLTWDNIEKKMKYTWNVVRESFRLIPPSIGSIREATDELTFAGFTIPKGWKVMWTAHSSHMNPDYFPEPEKFDPSRFEGSGPAPYTYVPFGGGPTMCPGRGFVKVVIMVFIHNVVTRFRLEKVIPNEKMVFHVSPIPAHGLPLRLLPHQY